MFIVKSLNRIFGEIIICTYEISSLYFQVLTSFQQLHIFNNIPVKVNAKRCYSIRLDIFNRILKEVIAFKQLF